MIIWNLLHIHQINWFGFVCSVSKLCQPVESSALIDHRSQWTFSIVAVAEVQEEEQTVPAVCLRHSKMVLMVWWWLPPTGWRRFDPPHPLSRAIRHFVGSSSSSFSPLLLLLICYLSACKNEKKSLEIQVETWLHRIWNVEPGTQRNRINWIDQLPITWPFWSSDWAPIGPPICPPAVKRFHFLGSFFPVYQPEEEEEEATEEVATEEEGF